MKTGFSTRAIVCTSGAVRPSLSVSSRTSPKRQLVSDLEASRPRRGGTADRHTKKNPEQVSKIFSAGALGPDGGGDLEMMMMFITIFAGD